MSRATAIPAGIVLSDDSLQAITAADTVLTGTSIAQIAVTVTGTITLPAAADFVLAAGSAVHGTKGRFLVVRRTDAVVAAVVTIDGDAAETIDGAASFALGCGASRILYCDGTSWHTASASSLFSTGAAPLGKAIIAGGAAGNHTATGIAVNDALVYVYMQNGTSGLLTDITSEFTITAADTINNAGGTNSTNNFLVVLWVNN